MPRLAERNDTCEQCSDPIIEFETWIATAAWDPRPQSWLHVHCAKLRERNHIEEMNKAKDKAQAQAQVKDKAKAKANPTVSDLDIPTAKAQLIETVARVYRCSRDEVKIEISRSVSV